MESTQTGQSVPFIKSTAGIIIIAVVGLAVGFFGGMEYKAYEIRTAIGQAINQTTQGLTNITNTLKQQESAQRDAKRLADARLIASSAELYFNDKSGYPSSLYDMVPTYIASVPTAPSPEDGNCTASQNQYEYKLISSVNYAFTFCLGTASGGYSAGVHTLSQAGIQ